MTSFKVHIYLFLVTVILSSCGNLTTNKEDKTTNNEVNHPSLILTQEGVKRIRAELGSVPLLDKTLERTKKEVDAEIELGIKMPIPKDNSGGYTHSRHKSNFFMMQKAGVLYQILDNDKYAQYVKDMLMAYEAMYKTLPLHPQTRSYARGKVFWQCLNDANWLVYVSQAYDCVYEFLTEEERNKLENNLFRPFTDHISVDSPQFFNRVHNHSTWGCVAVGMIGLVMRDDTLVERALNGINMIGDLNKKDNDGGYIRTEGQKFGFLANLDEPFSPDGYYTEGPYYQRYAMYPFLVFSTALNNVKPELKIFDHKDGMLLNAVNTLLNLTDKNGDFFPINDAQKGMSYYTQSLVTAVDVAYHFGGNNPELLSIAEKQNKVTLDDMGMSVALAIRDKKSKPYIKKSINLSDGSKGDKGGISVLRYGDEDLSLVFKYSAHGLSHGHYDKLSFMLYEKESEVLQDYGMSRFVNIEQKGGGNYLKENKTWAKQTIAHNTIVQDQKSQFEGKYDIGSKHHSMLYTYDDTNEAIQIVSAKEDNAYPGRTMVLVKSEHTEKPIIIDLMRIKAETTHQYDFPYYYNGQIISNNYDYVSLDSPEILGKKFGYQHLWMEGIGKPSKEIGQFTWLHNKRFYTITQALEKGDEILYTRIGASDPSFNLRRDPGILWRRNEKNTLFASIIEPHGHYNPVTEKGTNAKSQINSLKVITNTNEYTVIQIIFVNNESQTFILANQNNSKEQKHKLTIGNKEYQWVGPYFLK